MCCYLSWKQGWAWQGSVLNLLGGVCCLYDEHLQTDIKHSRILSAWKATIECLGTHNFHFLLLHAWGAGGMGIYLLRLGEKRNVPYFSKKPY